MAGAEKDRFTVAAGAGPVHEPLCFKGCRVQCAHQRVDGLRRCPGNGLVFIGADRAVDGNDDPDARVLRAVLAGAVDQVVAAEPRHGLAQLLCGATGGVIDIQGYHATRLAAAALAAALCQGSGHKAAVVLEQVLLGAGHGHVLCMGLGAHGAVPAGLLDEPWPGPVHLLPYFICSLCRCSIACCVPPIMALWSPVRLPLRRPAAFWPRGPPAAPCGRLRTSR